VLKFVNFRFRLSTPL
jgi:hypothetical protein